MLHPEKAISRDFRTWVRFPPAPPKRGNKKDIVPENPDAIGVFTVLEDGFSRAKIVDVKRTFSLCREI